MDIQQNTLANGSSPSATAQESVRALSTEFETFLRMLTVQMQNQDPLNPIESSDYAVQLATFSGVEQQVKTTDLLESLASQMGLMGISQLAGWVGMEARAAAPAYFDGNPVRIHTPTDPTADQAFLVVRDSEGAEVQRSELDRSQQVVEWAGVTPDGDPFPSGSYSFHVESRSNGEVIGATQAETYSVINEARSEGGEVVLVLRGGTEIAGSDVTALRAVD
jgi:flagellar basal-body rod modification protein FlgD